MTKTYTPLTIEGKIYVVVDAPDFDLRNLRHLVQNYRKDFAACTKYETLPEHAPYWKERIGQRVEEGEITIVTRGECTKEPCSCQYDAECPNYSVDHHYAIPPQQKQGDEAEGYTEPDTAEKIMDWVNNHVKQYGQLSQSKTKLAIKWIKKLNK